MKLTVHDETNQVLCPLYSGVGLFSAPNSDLLTALKPSKREQSLYSGQIKLALNM